MTQGNYASVNGLNISYEIHGTGRPLMRPGTTHVTLADRTDRLVSMITEFLDAKVQGVE